MNNVRLFALAVMPALSLFASATLADVSGPPGVSGNLVPAVEGEIKNAKACEGATFFKNEYPSLTNGDSTGPRTINFIVEGKTVPMTVDWGLDNSFSFALTGGYATKVGVTVDTNNFIYDYTGQPAKGVADTFLNFYGAGLTADDVNHLDLCLRTLDSDPPSVGVRVEPSSDGTTVAGTVSIIATVTDESPVNVDLEITSLDGTVTVPLCDPNDTACTELTGPTVVGNEYTWIWDSSLVDPGDFIIRVHAIDTSVVPNEAEFRLDVTVLTSAINCLEGGEGVPPGIPGDVLGCNPSGFQWVELPEELRNSGLLNGETLTQVAVPAIPAKQTDECGGEVDSITGVRPYPFVAPDPRWVNGTYVPGPLDLSEVFDVPADAVVMRSDTRGEPCLALIAGEASFSFADFYNPQTNTSLFGANRYTYTVTQLPETVELGLPVPDDVGPLGPGQIDLQKVPEATYQPTNRHKETFIGKQLGPFTKETFNPQRAKIPDFSYFALGTVQICESLLGTPLTGRAYYEAVLQCSTDLAVSYFDDLDLLMTYVGFPSLPNYPEPCLVFPTVDELRVELNKARSMIKVGDWTKATTRLTDLLTDVQNAQWRVDDRNCPGHVLMRVENLLWRTAQLEMAEGLLPAQ